MISGVDQAPDVRQGHGLVFVTPGGFEFGGKVAAGGTDRHGGQCHCMFGHGETVAAGEGGVGEGGRGDRGPVDQCHPFADLEGAIEVCSEQVTERDDVTRFAVAARGHGREFGVEHVQ